MLAPPVIPKEMGEGVILQFFFLLLRAQKKKQEKGTPTSPGPSGFPYFSPRAGRGKTRASPSNSRSLRLPPASFPPSAARRGRTNGGGGRRDFPLARSRAPRLRRDSSITGTLYNPPFNKGGRGGICFSDGTVRCRCFKSCSIPLCQRGRRRVRPPWAAHGFVGAFEVLTPNEPFYPSTPHTLCLTQGLGDI